MKQVEYDVEKVDQSLWFHFILAIHKARKLEPKKIAEMKKDGDFRKVLFKFPMGAYWSRHLTAPGDGSQLTGVIGPDTFQDLLNSEFLNEREWIIDTVLVREAKQRKLKEDMEVYLKWKQKEAEGWKT